MSYEVLARRWRPAAFDEVAGQKHITTALSNALRSGRLPHALLLCGPRGTGKTTLARILARALNCDEGPTDKPCGECPSCKEILSGASLDVQEIDAASNTGVDSVREIRDSIRYAAAPGKHRIYVIDEVHMLSSAAFNALLKTLEEPPPSSLFVFATTDPQKIPATVLSRVQRFDLKRLGASEALARLREIVDAEKIEIPESVLRSLVREGDGSLRDALTLLDRLTSALGNQIEEEPAIAILDLIDRRILVDILDPVLAQDPSAALVATRRALDKGIEPARLAGDLLAALRDLLVARIVDDPGDLLDVAQDELAQIRERAKPHQPETLQRLFRVLLARNQELTWASRPEHALEMAMVRLATLPDSEALSSLIARLDALERGGGGEPGPSTPGPARGNTRSGGGSRTARASATASATAAPATPLQPQPQASAAAPPAKVEAAARPEPPVAKAPEPRPEPAPPAVRPEPAPIASASAIEEPPMPTEEPTADDAPGLSRDRPAPSSGAEPLRSYDPSVEAKLRMEAKSHPLVQQVVEALDAELREIRVPRA